MAGWPAPAATRGAVRLPREPLEAGRPGERPLGHERVPFRARLQEPCARPPHIRWGVLPSRKGLRAAAGACPHPQFSTLPVCTRRSSLSISSPESYDTLVAPVVVSGGNLDPKFLRLMTLGNLPSAAARELFEAQCEGRGVTGDLPSWDVVFEARLCRGGQGSLGPPGVGIIASCASPCIRLIAALQPPRSNALPLASSGDAAVTGGNPVEIRDLVADRGGFRRRLGRRRGRFL